MTSPLPKGMRYRATAQVSVDTIKRNYNYIKSLTAGRVMAVVKADAYGHGAIPVITCMKILKNSGYDGWLSLEFEGMEDKLVGIELGLVNLKKFWEMA